MRPAHCRRRAEPLRGGGIVTGIKHNVVSLYHQRKPMSGHTCPNYLLFNIGKLFSGLDTLVPRRQREHRTFVRAKARFAGQKAQEHSFVRRNAVLQDILPCIVAGIFANLGHDIMARMGRYGRRT